MVLLPGDLSMARNHRDLQPDLAWLDRLPGTKVLARGNHDQWWNALGAIRPLLRSSQRAVDGDAVSIAGLIVCGTAGAPVPADGAGATAKAALDLQLAALGRALDEARRLQTDRREPIYVLWHYPPFDAHGRPGPCVAMLEQAGATACVYGHLHKQSEWSAAAQGVYHGVRYHCVAADAIGFCPLRIKTDDGRTATPQHRDSSSKPNIPR